MEGEMEGDTEGGMLAEGGGMARMRRRGGANGTGGAATCSKELTLSDSKPKMSSMPIVRTSGRVETETVLMRPTTRSKRAAKMDLESESRAAQDERTVKFCTIVLFITVKFFFVSGKRSASCVQPRLLAASRSAASSAISAISSSPPEPSALPSCALKITLPSSRMAARMRYKPVCSATSKPNVSKARCTATKSFESLAPSMVATKPSAAR